MTHTLMALCKTGDHILMVDCSYGFNRIFCKETLAGFGIDVEFISSTASSIAGNLRPQTRLVLLESPGYYTNEIQEIAAIAQEAHAAGALVAIDNSWGFGSSAMFDHGVDVSCVALSKYAGCERTRFRKKLRTT
ncbi:PLP-dependent transferase [Bradyrhizobium liaoningense]